MASVNKWIGIGNLGRDPEIRYMPDGNSVCNFSIACTEQWKNRDGEKQESTEWVRIVMYRRLAEIAGQYLKKGSQVYIEGALKTRKWQDKDGQERYTTEIIADEMKMLGPRQGAGQPEDFPRERGSSAGVAGGVGLTPSPASSSPPPSNNFNDFEDDIPF